jgi:hypothetical protein
MKRSPAALEADLSAVYRQQAAFYRSACAQAAELAADLQQGRLDPGKLQQIVSLLDEVTVLEQRLDETKLEWKQGGDKPGRQLQEALTEVATLLRQLGAEIDRAEQAAQLHKRRLAPQIDAAGRARQMQRAYRLWR